LMRTWNFITQGQGSNYSATIHTKDMRERMQARRKAA
jgi:hypothetical protein